MIGFEFNNFLFYLVSRKFLFFLQVSGYSVRLGIVVQTNCNFPLWRREGNPNRGHPDHANGEKKNEWQFPQQREKPWVQGSALLVWLLMYRDGKPDSWDVSMSYFLFSFVSWSWIIFPSHVGSPAARVTVVRKLTQQVVG